MARTICKILGVVFIVVAIWGFIHGSHVLIFPVNMAHNLVHLFSGIAALAVGFYTEAAARAFSIVFGLVYGLVAVAGFMHVDYVVNLLNLHATHAGVDHRADDFLHLALAIVFLIAGLVPARVFTHT